MNYLETCGPEPLDTPSPGHSGSNFDLPLPHWAVDARSPGQTYPANPESSLRKAPKRKEGSPDLLARIQAQLKERERLCDPKGFPL